MVEQKYRFTLNDGISEHPPQAVERPAMLQGWENLTFLHWPYQPSSIRGLLPQSLELDTFGGSAWVGLTPFVVTGLRAAGVPALPWLSRFPEMNVRTYVRGPEGERGIWFFSLEADRLAAVIGARLSYGLPYRWAKMKVRAGSSVISYCSHRHLGAGSAYIVVRCGAPIEPNELERFLTARFRLYSMVAGRLIYAQVEHPPWPLRSAGLVHIEQDVIQHSGVPAPLGEPMVHFSKGVFTRVGWPRLAAKRDGTARQ
jgi:uncharacterized protein YqjF (DUF2071 family)